VNIDRTTMTITSNDPLAIERAQEIDRLRVDLDREQKKRSALELALIHLREAVSLPRDFSQRDSQIETAWVEAGQAYWPAICGEPKTQPPLGINSMTMEAGSTSVTIGPEDARELREACKNISRIGHIENAK